MKKQLNYRLMGKYKKWQLCYGFWGFTVPPTEWMEDLKAIALLRLISTQQICKDKSARSVDWASVNLIWEIYLKIVFMDSPLLILISHNNKRKSDISDFEFFKPARVVTTSDFVTSLIARLNYARRRELTRRSAKPNFKG